MTPSAETYAEAVSNGAALLDARVPGWRDRVDVLDLELSSCGRCTLGQLFGHFDRGRFHLALDMDRAAVYGFALPIGVCTTDAREDAHWSALTAAWWKRVVA